MAGSIASEMMSIIDAKKYKQIIPALVSGTGLSEDLFMRTSLSERYILDMKWWLNGSYMNPRVLFELFGEYSNETTLKVRRNMLKYMGITKICGAESCAILKNAWISLHMKGLSACEWADQMFQRETPGEEIAIYTLCKMYKQHCMIFTTAKCWSTLEASGPITEAELFDLCDICLLYIEAGVFGELCMRPPMPPAPMPHGIFESATAIIGDNLTTPYSDTVSPPLNPSTTQAAETGKIFENNEDGKTVRDDAVTGNNVNNISDVQHDINTVEEMSEIKHENELECNTNDVHGDADELSTKFDPYLDARLSGCMEKIRGDLELDELLTNILANSIGHLYIELDEEYNITPNIPEFPDFATVDEPPETTPTMQDCMVKLDLLTDSEINYWLNPRQESSSMGYELRARPIHHKPV